MLLWRAQMHGTSWGRGGGGLVPKGEGHLKQQWWWWRVRMCDHGFMIFALLLFLSFVDLASLSFLPSSCFLLSFLAFLRFNLASPPSPPPVSWLAWTMTSAGAVAAVKRLAPSARSKWRLESEWWSLHFHTDCRSSLPVLSSSSLHNPFYLVSTCSLLEHLLK